MTYITSFVQYFIKQGQIVICLKVMFAISVLYNNRHHKIGAKMHYYSVSVT